MKLTFTFFIMLSSFLSIAQIVTDRPDQTEASSTVGLGNLQIESGILIQFEDDGQFRRILAPTNLFRLVSQKG